MDLRNESYKKNYLQIYLWKTLSFVVSFLSVFVVIPFLSSSKELYGIYTFCISFQMYLSYSDIGFLSAGQKYAAEAYAKADRKGEIKIFGFVSAVILAMIIPFSLVMLILAYNPNLIVKELNQDNLYVIRYLFLIMATMTPLQFILQRTTQSILGVRIKDYIAYRVDIVCNLIRVISTFYFFSEGRYLLVEYYFFINLITIIGCFITVYFIKKTEDFDFVSLLKKIRFSKECFNMMKKLSFTSLGMTFSWILCYELDLIYIGRIFSITDVAYFSVCLTLINFLRNIFGVIYGPFAQRFNHYVALNEMADFKRLLRSLVSYTFPLCLCITSFLFIFSNWFLVFWVGAEYVPSIPILKVMSFFVLFTFVTQPGAYVCTSTEQFRLLNISAIMCPVVFYLSVIVLYKMNVGIISFAIAKLAMSLVNTIIYFRAISKYVNVYSCIKIFLPSIIVILIIYSVSTILTPLLFPDFVKSKLYLAELMFLMCIYGVIYLSISYLSDSNLRNYILNKFYYPK